MPFPSAIFFEPMNRATQFSQVIRPLFLVNIAILSFGLSADLANAQKGKKADQLATVSGVIENDARKEFRVSYDEIKTSLRQVVFPPAPPFPANWKQMNETDQKQWLSKFFESDKGKNFLKRREKILNDASTFEVKYNDKGDFIVYDVPPGKYGLQGRVDKEIDGIKYGFEVFAEIIVEKDVDQIRLGKIPVTITPFFQKGQPAPEISLKSHKDEALNFDLPAYKGHYIFLNFMNTGDLTPGYQQQVQDMYKELGSSHKVKLITVVLDDKDLKKKGDGKGRTKAIKWIVGKKFTSGSFGFTDGWDHKIIEDYGVRSTPSGWLISPDEERKIVISQHEFYRLSRVKPTVTDIVRDRIDGKDTPTPAAPPEEVSQK